MTFIDFFAGIGGFRLGMEQAGHKCVGYVEIDKFAVKSYETMYNTKGEFYAADVRDIRAEDLPEADCYCGGFPCQTFSICGERRGFEDTRGTLIFEIFRIAEIRKPQILFFENVEGLLNHDKGRSFGTILHAMEELGYNVEWQCIDSWCMLPQSRKRIYIIGHIRGKSGQKVFPVRTSNTGNTSQISKQLRGRRKNCSGCCTTRQKKYGRNELDTLIYDYDKKTVRVLTPLEYFRLQGFPEELFYKIQAINSDTQLYKQIGNSVTVPIIHKIAERLDIR